MSIPNFQLLYEKIGWSFYLLQTLKGIWVGSIKNLNVSPFHFDSLLVCMCLCNQTAEALASQVTEEDYAKGIIYPSFKNVRKISATIAAKVASMAYEYGKYILAMKFISNLPLSKSHCLNCVFRFGISSPSS